MIKYKISVIVPVYKAEKFIERCVSSLLAQDLDLVEYIFINDATPDRSFEIVKALIKQSERERDIKLLENDSNLGVGKTRKKGMLEASGDYVIQIDSDDWIEPNMFSTLYNKIIEKDDDVAVCDYYISFLNGKKQYRREEYRRDIEYNLKSIMLGKVHPSFWNTLIKREFYLKNELVPSGEVNMGEDFETMFRVFSKTDKVAYVPHPFIHYTQYNTQSITKTMNPSHIKDTIHSIKLFEKTLEPTKDRYIEEFRIMLLFWKKMFVLNKEYTHYFYEIRSDANKFKYLFSENGYGVFQKIAISFMLLRMPFITRIIYKTYRQIKTKL